MFRDVPECSMFLVLPTALYFTFYFVFVHYFISIIFVQNRHLFHYSYITFTLYLYSIYFANETDLSRFRNFRENP